MLNLLNDEFKSVTPTEDLILVNSVQQKYNGQQSYFQTLKKQKLNRIIHHHILCPANTFCPAEIPPSPFGMR
jgi:hypothetical protein